MADACSSIEVGDDGATTVRVTRVYAGGLPPTTAQRVWDIASDFGGVKTIFPLLVRVNIAYPDNGTTRIGQIRDMSFAPPDPTKPMSPDNPLAGGIEQLVQLDDSARRLAYTSLSGMPLTGYMSTMEVFGDDECELVWTSRFTLNPGAEGFDKIITGILTGGANQIAVALGVD